MTAPRAITRRDAAFRAAVAPLLAAQDEAARLIARATETDLGRLLAAVQPDLGALLAGLGPVETAGYPARKLRPGENVEVAALVDAERARHRRPDVAGGRP